MGAQLLVGDFCSDVCISTEDPSDSEPVLDDYMIA